MTNSSINAAARRIAFDPRTPLPEHITVGLRRIVRRQVVRATMHPFDKATRRAELRAATGIR